MRKILVAVAIALFACASQAATTVPHTLVAGTAAKASDVNDNFNTLATTIDGLLARLCKLEGTCLTTSDVAGTYTWTGFQTGLSTTHVEELVFNGTLTLRSDGTATAVLTEQSGSLTTTGGAATNSTKTTTTSGTWTTSGNTITVTVSGGTPVITFTGAAGNHILVGSVINNATGGSTTLDRQIMVITRN